MNSLPIPILDGGHVLFLVVEWVRGKPIKQETQNWIHGLFFYLFIILALLVAWLDYLRLMP
jgi:regulator of sigma E protease